MIFFCKITKISLNWNKNTRSNITPINCIALYLFREEKKEIERRKLIHDRNVKMKQHLQSNHDGQNQSELL